MTAHSDALTRSSRFELCFRSLFNPGRGLAFPCDAAGHVDLNALSERARHNYFDAHALMGRDYAAPVLRVAGLC